MDSKELDDTLLDGIEIWGTEGDMDSYRKIECILTIINVILMQFTERISTCYRDKFPNLYQKAFEIVKDVFEIVEYTPFKVSRTITKVFKNVDVLCQELMLPQLNLSDKIALSPVLTTRQLDLNLRQVFDVEQRYYGDEQVTVLKLCATGQVSAFIRNANNINTDEISVRVFFEQHNITRLIK